MKGIKKESMRNRSWHHSTEF